MTRLLIFLVLWFMAFPAALAQGQIPFGPNQPYLGGSRLIVNSNTTLTGTSPSLIEVTTANTDVIITLAPTAQCIGKSFLITFSGTTGSGLVIINTTGSDTVLGASANQSITLTTVSQQLGIVGDGIGVWSAFAPDVLSSARGGGGGGGGGGISTVGDLPPLFTSDVSGATLTFSQNASAANSWFGNPTGSSANPTFNTTVLPNVLVNWASPSAIGTGTPAAGTFSSVSLPSSGFLNSLATASLTGSHICTLPNAASNPIQPLGSASAHQWVSYIDANGVQHPTQPAFSDLSGSIVAGQQPATTVNSTGNLSPLFTSNISAQGLSFAQSTAAANSWFGNPTGSSANPTFNTTVLPNALVNWASPSAIGTSSPAAATFTQVNIANSGFNNQIVSSALSGTQTCTLPAANSNPIQPLASAPAGEFVSFIDSTGTQHLSTPSGGGGSGTVGSGTTGQEAVYPSNGTAVQGNPNVNSTNGAVAFGQSSTVGGSLQLFGPTSGSVTISPAAVAGTGTTVTLPASNSTTVIPSTLSAHNFANQVTSGGALAGAQPAFSDISGSVSTGQLPAAVVLGPQSGSGGQFVNGFNSSGVATYATPSGSGTVNSGVAGQSAYYPASTSAVSGNPNQTSSNGDATFGNATGPVGGSLTLIGSTSGSLKIAPPAIAGTASTLTPPSGASVSVLPSTLASHNFANQVTAGGVLAGAQPAFSDLSGTATTGQLPTSIVYGAQSFAAHNFATGADASGNLTHTQPAFTDLSGTATNAQLPADAVVGPQSLSAHNFANGANSSGVLTGAQPAFTDVSGTATSGQLPATVVYNNQANTYSTGLQDMSAATNFKLPLITDPVSAAGSFWINGPLLKFWDNAGTPVKHTVATIDTTNGYTADQLPSAAGGNNLGSASVPWGNAFLGSLASKSASFSGLSSLTANRSIFVPDAASSVAQGASSVSHQWLNSFSATTGAFSQTQPASTDLSDSSNVALRNNANGFSADQTPTTAGSNNLGTAALPWAGAYIGGAATNNNKIVSSTTTAARVCTLPDANSNPVIPSTLAAHNFANQITSGGVLTGAQPAFTDVSGAASIAQLPTGNANTALNGLSPSYLPAWIGAPATDTSNQTLTSSSIASRVLDGTSGAVTDILPAASSNAGQKFLFCCINSAHTVTLTPNGSDTIGGASTFVLTAGQTLIIESDGTAKWKIWAAPPVAGSGVTITYTNGVATFAASGGGSALNFAPGGRLTLTSNVPVTTSDVTAATTLYYTPYVHNTSFTYSSAWAPYTFTQYSIAVPASSFRLYDAFDNGTGLTLTAWDSGGQTTGSITAASAANPCVLTAVNSLSAGQYIGIAGVTGSMGTNANSGLNGKVFEVASATGTSITLETGNDTTGLTYTLGGTFYVIPTSRTTAVSYLAGHLAQTGTNFLYLGSMMTTSTSGQTEDSAARRLVSNTFNRVSKRMFSQYSPNNATWTYASLVSRPSNATTTAGLARTEFVCAQQENALQLAATSNQACTTNFTVASQPIGLDSVAANSAQTLYSQNYVPGLNQAVQGWLYAAPSAGYHFVQKLEQAEDNGGTAESTTYYPNNYYASFGNYAPDENMTGFFNF